MHLEETRLRTFTGWPTNAVISPARIARAGFYYTNENLTVKCFWCDVEISEWNYGDQVMARHRQLSPTCAFVVDPANSGNVPNISNTEERTSCTSVGSVQSFTQETDRLESFANWPVPHIVSPERLARAGFYYLMRDDRTKCAFCNGVVLSWEEGDNPDLEHKRHFPHCHFVETVINPRLEQQTNAEGNGVEQNNRSNGLTFSNVHVVSQGNLNELGINEHTAPRRRRYATLESRIRTFEMWPDDLIQTPNVLAQAGFYYEGYGDQVRCFHCDGGLRHWDPQDDPWTEHARWFPTCAFVLLVKGREFITACSIENHLDNMTQTSQSHTTPFQRHQVTEREIQSQMLTPEVIAALNVGLHVGRIKQAIKEKLERTGVGFATPDAVIEAALNIQIEEDEIADSRIAEQVSSILTDAIQHTLNRNTNTNEKNQNPTKTATEPPPTRPAEPNITSEDSHHLQEENRQLREARLCKICMDNEVGIVFLPCGHLATCVNCTPNLRDCPVCRSTIEATVRTFLS